MQVELLGIGTAAPPLSITRDQSIDAARALCAEEDDDHADLLATLYRQSGIEARGILFGEPEFRRIVYAEGAMETPFAPRTVGDRGPSTAVRMERFEAEALPMAVESSGDALAKSGVDPATITHLVTVSCTGLAAPGFDLGLIKRLGLSPDVERTHVGFMGCHGSLNGLRVARGLIAAEPASRVLLCSVELCSLHLWYGWNPKKMVGNALFADGSAAAVLGAAPYDEPRDRSRWRLAANGARLFPNSEQAMSWHVRDHGFEMVLSTKVPGLIQQNIGPWLESWLATKGLAPSDVASWAVHPGGPRVLSSVQEALGLAPEAVEVSRTILASRGNMSSATILFILDELMRRDAPRPCVALGFGPGLAAEGALFL
ncbi:type III polyketide synthase [Paludisphaera soli]|uniref:type III polyketide synthase n=1 Tax=Paludisphaera soli TaxID=2712865 RepID=UPI0013EB70EC|nr:type III polyketide synthase [Paludisphaera soli]